jgi:ATP-binding cassette subfamily B (MDR/TAP) protein 1
MISWIHYAYQINSIAEATAAAGRIIGIRPSKEIETQPRMPHGRGPAKVEFQNVYFTYKDREVPVLQGVNIRVSDYWST